MYVQVHKFSLQFGRTALLYASQYGHVEAVQMLLQQNADTTITDVVCTLAMEACLVRICYTAYYIVVTTSFASLMVAKD